MQGTNTCSYCEVEFTPDNPCWDSYATYDDGSHDDGVCLSCAARQGNIAAMRQVWDGKAIAGGIFQRGE